MGKGGGALSAWIKEFTALVFTQTIQAFIYAIVISIILFGMTHKEGVSGEDVNSALGLMATFALLSVFKVEEMAKKIFGISDTKASPGSAIKSITKLAIAGQLGKKVLNNAGKVLGGVKAVNQSRKDNAKAKKRLDEDMADNGYINGEFQAKSESADMNASGTSESDSSGTGNVSSGRGNVSSGDGNFKAISDADKRRVKNALRTYEDRVSEIKKAREQGVKDICSGVAETIGAVAGAAPGAVFGAALSGEIEDALTGMISGAGIGDVIGKSSVEAVDRATKFVQRNYNAEKGISSKELKKAISNYKDALEKSTVHHIDVDDID